MSLTFKTLAAINKARCQGESGFNRPLGSWSLSDWMTATMGELGEAANCAKKLNRIRDGVLGNGLTVTEESLKENLKDEIADVLIYLDLLAQSQGFSLEEIVIKKFNETSRKIGCSLEL